MSGITWFWPGVALALPLTLVCARPLAHALRIRPWLAWLLAYAVAIILVATLTPILRRPGAAIAVLYRCDLSRLSLATPADLGRINDISLNIALFIPLGLAIAWLPSSPRKVGIAFAAVVAPFAIEILQALLPALARGCQSGDVIDNLTGLAIGLVAGSAVGWLATRLVTRRR